MVLNNGDEHTFDCEKTEGGFNVWAKNGYELEAVPGEEISLEVETDATVELSYSWYLYNDTDGYVKLDGNGASLSVTPKQNYESYKCVISNGTHTRIVLFVLHLNHLTAYVYGTEDKDAKMGFEPDNNGTTLRVSVNADDKEGITYKWEKEYDTVLSEVSDSLTIESVQKPANYYCYVTDRFGNTEKVSFHVYVDNNLVIEGVTAETIYVVPGSQTELEVKVSANHMEGVEIIWQQCDVNLSTMIETRGTSCKLTTPAIEETTVYYVYAKDSYGNYASTYTIYIYPDNEFRLDPQNYVSTYSVAPGSKLTLEAVASGHNLEGAVYSWYVENEYGSYQPIPDSNSLKYTIDEVNARQNYMIKGVDRYGNSVNVYFYVSANDLKFDYEHSVLEADVKPGESVTLKAVVTAYDMSQLSYEWNYWDSEKGENIVVGTEATLEITNVTGSMYYNVTVTDQYGNSVEGGGYVICNHFTVEPKDGKTSYAVKDGSEKTLELVVSADDMTGITYEWSIGRYVDEEDGNGNLVRNWKETQLDATGNTCTVIKESDMWVYATVNDKYGNSSTLSFYLGSLSVNLEKNAIYQNYSEHWYSWGDGETWLSCYVDMKEGIKSAVLKLSVESTAAGDITYEWYEWGYVGNSYQRIPIEGASGSSYTARKNAYFDCIVKDSDGNVVHVQIETWGLMETLPGDVNLDGEVDANDLTVLARHVAKIESITDPDALANADVDGDGSVDANDLTRLARHVAKIELLA